MNNNGYSFDEILNGISKTLKTLLSMMERANMHHLVKENCSFYFDGDCGKMHLELNRNSLTDGQFRELRARVGKSFKLCKALNNLFGQFKVKSEYVDVSVRSKQTKRLISLIAKQIQQCQAITTQEYAKKNLSAPDFTDLTQLKDDVFVPKKSLIILNSINNYYIYNLNNINYYEF